MRFGRLEKKKKKLPTIAYGNWVRKNTWHESNTGLVMYSQDADGLTLVKRENRNKPVVAAVKLSGVRLRILQPWLFKWTPIYVASSPGSLLLHPYYRVPKAAHRWSTPAMFIKIAVRFLGQEQNLPTPTWPELPAKSFRLN